MEILSFKNPTHPGLMEQASIVEGIEEKFWVERYSSFGEFEFSARLDSNLINQLPIGSYVSHTNTAQLMIVENHEVSSNEDEPPKVKVTGRTFDTILEGRVVGSNLLTSALSQYLLPTDTIQNQIRKLILDHIESPPLLNARDAIPYLSIAIKTLKGSGEERVVNVGDLYTRVKELMDLGRVGIRTYRPGPWSPIRHPWAPSRFNVVIEFHKGSDKRSSVTFSYDKGEIESADYLWSNRNMKDSVFVYGKWLGLVVNADTTTNGHARRMGYLEAKDIDEAYEAFPGSGDRDRLLSLFEQRGREYLARQIKMALTKVNLSPLSSMPSYSDYFNQYPPAGTIIPAAIFPSYRKSFDVGDVIRVIGEFGDAQDMRLLEMVEVEDDNGFRRQPTLAVADEEDLRFY